jgi:hypothetical protein
MSVVDKLRGEKCEISRKTTLGQLTHRKDSNDESEEDNCLGVHACSIAMTVC